MCFLNKNWHHFLLFNRNDYHSIYSVHTDPVRVAGSPTIIGLTLSVGQFLIHRFKGMK